MLGVSLSTYATACLVFLYLGVVKIAYNHVLLKLYFIPPNTYIQNKFTFSNQAQTPDGIKK